MSTLALALPGCATLLTFINGSNINDSINFETTIVKPDGVFVWAPALEYGGDGSSKAKNEADKIAKQQAAYQTTQQVVVWKDAGFDYEYNKMDLNNAIANGTYRYGMLFKNTATSAIKYDHRNHKVSGGEKYLIDPSKPATYYAVQIKTFENRTVDLIDETKYKRVYEQNYQPLYDRYHKEYVEKRNHAFTYIKNKMKGELVDIPNDMVIFPAEGERVKGNVLKSILQKRLSEITPGSTLVYGGAYDDLVFVASLKNGVFECKLAK